MLVVVEVEVVEGLDDTSHPVRIRITPNALSPSVLSGLKELLSEHPGQSEVFLHLSEQRILRLPPEFCVDASTGLMGELRVLLGPDALLA